MQCRAILLKADRRSAAKVRLQPEDELYKNHNISNNLGSSVAYYGSTAYTFTIHLPFGFRINITPSIQASHSESVNRTVASLMDIDGDGLPDLVYSNSDSRLVVHRNLTGRTNLLRTVTLPFGGHIHIGYAQTEPSFDMPGRRWVMSSVETTGGYKENGATSTRNEFTYEGGYRDRRERDFYGFRKVTTRQIDTEKRLHDIYRYSVDTYANNRDYYLHGLVTDESLYDGAGRKLQGASYTYETVKVQDAPACAGTIGVHHDNTEVLFPALTSLVQSNFDEASGDSLTTKVENTYDDFGNLLTYQETAAGEKLDARIDYAYGYSSTTTYDGLWNAPATTTDLNGQRMEYSYDALGRQATVRAPYEIESGQPFTIKFEYFPKERKAHTIHYTQDGNIDTYTFADSLMRAVQTKRTGVVWNGGSASKVSIVSGRAVLDAFGRNIAAYYPVTESYGNIGTYNTATGDLQAKTEYDTHDRTVSVTLADGSTTRSAYTIGSHDGVPMLETKVTDALGRTAESYTDGKGRNRETVQHAGGENIIVRYAYNPVNEVTTVTHPNGRETKYEYDQLGRKLMVNHPDAGETDMTYDAAGNLLTKLTAQLRKSISDKGCITYTYDYERLKEVLYPENLFNRVTYTYGQPGDKYNRAGRLALVEDASGGEAYYYGCQGEVTKTVRTVMASVADIRTYVYGVTYDSWNRVRTMTYPDGEVVTYHYNAAGQVESLTSSKQGKESSIVAQIGYDKDGHTVYQKLGNGTETTYTYDKQRQRLQDMTLTGSGSTLMQNKYRYDAVDNILGITNAANPQGLTKLNKAKLGGASTHTYQYDELNRLIHATGKAKSATYDMAMTFGRMSEPLTKVQRVDSSLMAKSYNFAYKYEDENHPTAPTQIGHDHYTYDANGDPTLVTNDSTNTTRERCTGTRTTA
ncbi:YD repeat protein [Hallella multisaccharivorax DSM 17128]|uniref:YD repeat protein n=1 Tax=Hallella multisaccharivorax DSM 17128 TaxID=688246 RepID=F8NBD9_9BACT|nr:YD repeat protein [Hallella multisaccharivorax DSM 17128]